MKAEVIAEKLALKMGWTKRTYCKAQIFVEDGNDGDYWDCSEGEEDKICTKKNHLKQQEERYYDALNRRVKIRNWSPAARWDHIGIVIEWEESNGRPLTIKDFESGRKIQFGSGPEIVTTFGGELPHYIALAALGESNG